MSKIKFICDYCGEMAEKFSWDYNKSSNRHFCNNKCYHLWDVGENHPNFDIPMTIEQKELLSKLATERGSFAGERNPFYGSHRVGEDNPFYGKKHSPETRAYLSEQAKIRINNNIWMWCGENSSQWKGGITPENQEFRCLRKYASWRILVFERDDYTCIKCDQVGGWLEAHHQRNFSDHENLRLVVANGITFCEDCHGEFHHIFGKKNNSPVQVMKFLLM